MEILSNIYSSEKAIVTQKSSEEAWTVKQYKINVKTA